MIWDEPENKKVWFRNADNSVVNMHVLAADVILPVGLFICEVTIFDSEGKRIYQVSQNITPKKTFFPKKE